MATVDLATVAQPQEAAPECTVLAPMEHWQKQGFASMRAWKSADNKKRYAAAKAAKKEVAAEAAAAAAATAASESALAALAAVASPMLPIQSLPASVPELYPTALWHMSDRSKSSSKTTSLLGMPHVHWRSREEIQTLYESGCVWVWTHPTGAGCAVCAGGQACI